MWMQGPTRYCARHISQRMACWRPELCRWARHQLFKQDVCTHLIVPAQNVLHVFNGVLQWCSAMPPEPNNSSICDVARCRTSTAAAISRLSVRLIRLLCAPEQRHGAMRSPMSVSSCAPQHMRHCRTSGGAGIPLARRLRGRCHFRGRRGSGRSDGPLSLGGGGLLSPNFTRGKAALDGNDLDVAQTNTTRRPVSSCDRTRGSGLGCTSQAVVVTRLTQ